MSHFAAAADQSISIARTSLGVFTRDDAATRDAKHAVPAAAIQIAGTNLTSTFEEAMAARHWSRASGATSLLIPTGSFHSRRVRWVFRKNLGDTVRITVTSIRPEECRDWWMDEKALLDFQNEFVKFVLYRLRY